MESAISSTVLTLTFANCQEKSLIEENNLTGITISRSEDESTIAATCTAVLF